MKSGAQAEALVKQLLSKYASANWADAKRVAREAVATLKSCLLATPGGWSESDLNSAFIAAVFFRSLYDVAVLDTLVQEPNWSQDEKKIESIWNRFCDCRDRFEFTERHFQGTTVERTLKFLARIEGLFFENFGPGTYISPNLIFDKLICSICENDTRACQHIQGRVYGGKLCARIYQNASLPANLASGSLVTTPRDPCCRVWPWMIKDGKSESVPFLIFFRVDDFMENDNWS